LKFTGEIKGFLSEETRTRKTVYFYVHKHKNGEVNTAVMVRVDERQQRLQ